MLNRIYLKIFGERNTGTNYLQQLIKENLDVHLLPGSSPVWINKLQSHLFGKNWLNDFYFSLTFKSNLGWKHRLLKLDDFTIDNVKDVFFITLTKNPYSWLLSLYRRPYHHYNSKTQSFSEFLISPWNGS